MQVCSTGGMVRFKTDSDTLAIKSVITYPYTFPHFSIIGLAGMDVYIGKGKNKRYLSIDLYSYPTVNTQAAMRLPMK